MWQFWIWVATVPAVGVYLWSVVAWPKTSVRVAASATFMAFYLAVLWFGNMDFVWRILMPLVVVVAMGVFLVRGRTNDADTQDGAPGATHE